MKHLVAALGLIGLAACSAPETTVEEPEAAMEAEPEVQSEPTMDAAAEPTALEVVQSYYGGMKAGDMDAVRNAMADDIEWNEAQSHPYADNNPYIGADEIFSGVFARFGSEWDGFAAVPNEFISEGNRVVVFGRYSGTYKATGKQMDAPYVHSYTVEDGKIVKFQQYTDTANYVEAVTE